MPSEIKMWYTIKQAAEYLNMQESRLQRKITGLNIGTRTLPGEKGEFISRKDVLDLERMTRPSATPQTRTRPTD
jgi:hypothetical protein